MRGRRTTLAVAMAVLVALVAGCSKASTSSSSTTATSTTAVHVTPATPFVAPTSAPPYNRSAAAGQGKPDTFTTVAPSLPTGSQAKPLAIGTASSVAGYKIAITAIELNGTAAVMGANEFNDPPSKGQYVVVTYQATWLGKDQGVPDLDLDFALIGSDGGHYASSDCNAVTPDSKFDATLDTGGSVTSTVCMDVPPAATLGAVVQVKAGLGANSPIAAYWR